MENTSEKKYLTLIQKVGYGVGDLGSNYCWTVCGIIYYDLLYEYFRNKLRSDRRYHDAF